MQKVNIFCVISLLNLLSFFTEIEQAAQFKCSIKMFNTKEGQDHTESKAMALVELSRIFNRTKR